MFWFETGTGDPFFNLACEDWLLHNHPGDFIILGINDPSVIVGKHQVVHREVNTPFIDENDIPVIRRISGGGTVYHDHGNLNFTFIRQSEKGKQIDFRFYTKPVIGYLRSKGVEAFFEGKNDIRVDGLKISGNAEHIFRDRVLHHGTLLFDASLETMRKALRQENELYNTRAVVSNRTSVANLKGRLEGIDDINGLKSSMFDYFMQTTDGIEKFTLTQEQSGAIKNLADNKYKSWEWTWGYAPPYTIKSVLTANSLPHTCILNVRDGIIWQCEFAGSNELKYAGKQLIGCRHMFRDVADRLKSENIDITDEETYKLF